MTLIRLLIVATMVVVVASAAIKGVSHLREVVIDTLLTLGLLIAIGLIFRSRGRLGATGEEGETPAEVIQHELPWQVVDQGKSLGTFQNQPIPAWIRTSDGRQAFYSGVWPDPIPERSVCLEMPARGELVIPPGLVYSCRAQGV